MNPEPLSMDEILELLPALMSAGRQVQLSSLKGEAYWKMRGDREWRNAGGNELSLLLKARLEIMFPNDTKVAVCPTAAIVSGRKLSFKALKKAVQRYSELNPSGLLVVNRPIETETAHAWPGALIL